MYETRGHLGAEAIAPSSPDLRILDGIASWCGGLHGSMTLGEALKALSMGLGAEAALIARDARRDDTPRIVANFDARSGDADADIIRKSYASDVLGSYRNKVRASSIWFLSDRATDPDWRMTRSLQSLRMSREIGDIAIISLAATAQQHDYLEFHFAEGLSRAQESEFAAIVPTLVRAWAGRMTGLVTQAHMDERMIRARAAAKASRIRPDAPILGMSNPAGLSRAEFRVCLLLSRGLSVKGIRDELGLTEATVRSHLRSVYSKTHTSGHAELLYRILSAETEERASRASGR